MTDFDSRPERFLVETDSSINNRPEKTSETGKTYTPSNAEFLGVVFKGRLGQARPLVVSFTGNPNKVSSHSWVGKVWREEQNDILHSANNFFSLADFMPDSEGTYRRKKEKFHQLSALMFDDVGTKVGLDRMVLSPSWLLETSAGNYQGGYILREPIADAKKADALMKAIIKAGLCDPGAGGPTTRLARLPIGINGKYEPAFECRLAQWSPENRYSAEEIITAFNLDLTDSKPTARTKNRRIAKPRPADGFSVFLRPSGPGGVLAKLQERGLYKSSLGDGRHDVTCPWVSEHTDRVDSGAAYFEPNEKFPTGGFKCLHGHCADRRLVDLLRFLGLELAEVRSGSTIRVIPGQIHQVVDAAEQALAEAGNHYQRGGLIVSVLKDHLTGDALIQTVGNSALVGELASSSAWERFDRDWVAIDPPARAVNILFDKANYKYLPVLRGLSRQPYLREDGSLVTSPGYDPASEIFCVFDDSKFRIKQNPTLADAKSALEIIKDLLCEFSFASESDQAAAISAILTAVVRPSLAKAPMFHVRAHQVGSGKSCLCELITAFATPRRGSPTTFPGEDEECRKLLIAQLLLAPAVIEFDNITTDLIPHNSLCTAITSEYISGRILGASKTVTLSTRVLFLSSGNNFGPVLDMARRCITIHLDPACEVPASRTFKNPNLLPEIFKYRNRYVGLALTLIRAWISAGSPHTACRPLAGFDRWSELCRQPLLWLGLADPSASLFEAIEHDPSREVLGRFLEAWVALFGTRPAMIRDVVSKAGSVYEEFADLRDVVLEIAGERGEVNRRRLGWWLKRHEGRLVNGRKFVQVESGGSAAKWQVLLNPEVSKVLEVSSSQCENAICTVEDYVQATTGA
jgi:hypothetical protein